MWFWEANYWQEESKEKAVTIQTAENEFSFPYSRKFQTSVITGRRSLAKFSGRIHKSEFKYTVSQVRKLIFSRTSPNSKFESHKSEN